MAEPKKLLRVMADANILVVDYLVTNDKDLTAQDETTVALRQKVQPMIVGKFLSDVMGWDGEDLERIRRRNWSDL
ncbi:MAG: hypothetical protein E3J21_22440 [Anaerolineales bacterium]|nr:MAG: hypothetical protein E3J21_22440 [Anaerolineales bacterium]